MIRNTEILQAVSDAKQYARGAALHGAGCVKRIAKADHKGYLRFFAVVFDGENRFPAFSFTPAAGAGSRISGCSCDCPGYAATLKPCAHVAALLLAMNGSEYAAELEGAPAAAEPVARLSVYRDEMSRRREKYRLERERQEREENERRRGEIDALIDSGYRNRIAYDEGAEKVRLFPVLSLSREGMALELRIGTAMKRAYLVRSMGEFARRMSMGESAAYGKGLTFSHREQDVEEGDRALLWQIVSAAQGAGDGARVPLSGAMLDQVMRLLIGREVEFRAGQGKTDVLSVEAGGGRLPLRMALEGGKFRLTIEACAAAGSAGAYFVLPEEGKLLCAFGQTYEKLAPLLRLAAAYPQGAIIDDDQLPGVCANLISPAAEYVCVAQGEEIIRAHTPMALTPRFYIDMPDRNRIICRLVYDYGAAQLTPGEQNPHIRRDTAAEEAAEQAARGLFTLEEPTGEYAFEGDDDACFELISRQLASLEPYGEVMIAERMARQDVKTSRAMSFGVSPSENGMLIVKADLGGMTQEDLQAAYLAYRLRKKYVRLRDGAFLSGEALEQAADAAQVADSLDVTAQALEEGAEVSAGRALYLESALKERETIRLNAPKEVSDWVARLKKAQKTRAQNPALLRATLRDYQLEGLSWMTALSEAGFGGILADDMGLGKTMQALALLLTCMERGENVRALVVCPASLQLNWLSEAEKFAPDLVCCALMGGAQARAEDITDETPPHLTITSYDQLRRDVQVYKGVQFTHIFLDEAQNIKNAASQAARAVKTLRADHRFAMTGTPIENRLSELWSIFDFLMPGYLLTYKKFKERFEVPIVREDSEKAQKNLRGMVAPFILRRMKADVLDDLPEKTEKLMTSEMTQEQAKLYHAHAAQLIDGSEGGFADPKDRIRLLAGLTRLRQICCDPRLCLEGYAGGSGKLEQCLELAAQMIGGGHRVLLFSQFTSMLDILRSSLEERGISVFMLTGDTDKQERMELVERFNDGSADVFLISLKAGGTGLNLTGADVVIHYDPWWNTSAQNQATDRAYRIGQKRGVQVFKLIAAGTIEERILRLQQAKADLSEGVLSGEENLFTMDAEAFRKLLR